MVHLSAFIEEHARTNFHLPSSSSNSAISRLGRLTVQGQALEADRLQS